MAALIWQTAISPLNHGQARFGKEVEIVMDLLHGFGKLAEEEAVVRSRLMETTSKKRRSKKTANAKSEFALQSYVPLKDADLITDVARSPGRPFIKSINIRSLVSNSPRSSITPMRSVASHVQTFTPRSIPTYNCFIGRLLQKVETEQPPGPARMGHQSSSETEWVAA
jgi:hypothetical protein